MLKVKTLTKNPNIVPFLTSNLVEAINQVVSNRIESMIAL
jgi:hypothetical protein